MISKWHETEAYHKFLVSNKRSNYIPDQIYSKLIQPVEDSKKHFILDFGTGFGYSALMIGQSLSQYTNYHIYACDHQEELLDHFWYTITRKGIKNITPFFLPSYSRINFPEWLPKMSHLICSLSLSASENPGDVLETIYKVALEDAFLHIIEWNGKNIPPEIKRIIPHDSKLDLEKMELYLREHNYRVVKSHSKNPYFYALTVQKGGQRS